MSWVVFFPFGGGAMGFYFGIAVEGIFLWRWVLWGYFGITVDRGWARGRYWLFSGMGGEWIL